MMKSNDLICNVKFYRIVNNDYQLLFAIGSHNHLTPPPHKPTTVAKNYLAEIISNNPVIQNHDIKYGNGCSKASTIHISLQNGGKLASEKRKQEEKLFGNRNNNIEEFVKIVANEVKNSERTLDGIFEFECIFPYIRHNCIIDEYLHIHLQHPLMSKMMWCKYIVVDVQHNSKMGIDYHCLNICTFNDSLEKTITLARCLINGIC